ncbi:hypothetical protein DdX_18438 [Ditylenchus destructor]|uniref:Uncharacterized protein n=1 Tax=Ditylenchus destructor TaxID=166010 RepID=A0AAD4MLK8_9BILA|nr:hypothetical protein DdX_18438 [Ditylenchus destructor]
MLDPTSKKLYVKRNAHYGLCPPISELRGDAAYAALGLTYRHVFDFVLSYSGMERIGLGRDDEDLDHFGDINEMRRIGCLLKPGGFLFLRLPLGHDQITTNCYRVYGRIRLALLIEVENE